MKAQTETKINYLITKVKELYDEVELKSKLFSALGKLKSIIHLLEKEKDMKFVRLSEEHKLLLEEKEAMNGELNAKRNECLELTYTIKEHIQDQTSIQNTLDGGNSKKSNNQINLKIQKSVFNKKLIF